MPLIIPKRAGQISQYYQPLYTLHRKRFGIAWILPDWPAHGEERHGPICHGKQLHYTQRPVGSYIQIFILNLYVDLQDITLEQSY